MSYSESRIRIGTSGWSYREWEGIFYPDSKTPKLSYYSRVFSTAEIDSTFYANPSKGLVMGWLKNTPEDFEFSVKLPKKITHDKQLDLSKDAEIDLKEFLYLLGPLKNAKKLGPLLIQLPPSFSLSKKGLLEEFFKALPNEYLFAVEFRNKSWLKDPELYPLLSKYNVSNTIVDEPLLPIDLRTSSSEFVFVRWHGRGKRPWYDYRYSEEELLPWIEGVREVSKKTKRVYGYFNNHFHANAIENGLEFLQKLGLSSKDQEEILNEIKEKRQGKKALFDSSQKTLGEFAAKAAQQQE